MDLKSPEALAAILPVGAALLRALVALLKSPLAGGLLGKLPKDLRPLVPLALSAALAGIDHLVSDGDILRAVVVGLGVFTGSEVSYRMQRGRAERKAANAVDEVAP